MSAVRVVVIKDDPTNGVKNAVVYETGWYADDNEQLVSEINKALVPVLNPRVPLDRDLGKVSLTYE